MERNKTNEIYSLQSGAYIVGKNNIVAVPMELLKILEKKYIIVKNKRVLSPETVKKFNFTKDIIAEISAEYFYNNNFFGNLNIFPITETLVKNNVKNNSKKAPLDRKCESYQTGLMDLVSYCSTTMSNKEYNANRPYTCSQDKINLLLSNKTLSKYVKNLFLNLEEIVLTNQPYDSELNVWFIKIIDEAINVLNKEKINIQGNEQKR